MCVSGILDKYVDWKDFLVKRLTGARTLPKDFYPKVQESLTKHPLKPGMLVEVVDRTCVSAMRVATVEEVIGGRLRLQYEDSKVRKIVIKHFDFPDGKGIDKIDGLTQKRCNSSALAMELRLFCANP